LKGAAPHQYYNPVTLAQYALNLIYRYTTTGEKKNLDLSTRIAQKLKGVGLVHKAALYFPYPADFWLHSNKSEQMSAPW